MLNHYLPQYYLRGFTESATSELVWVYEKNTDRVFRTSVANVACEHDFYRESDERYLANKIEGPGNRVIEKIREKQDISPEEKKVLSRYLSSMWARVPKYRERVEEMTPAFVQSFFDGFVGQIDSFEVENSAQAQVLEACKREVEHLRATYKIELPPDLKREAEKPVESEVAARVLYFMRWRFLTAGEGLQFIAGDNPLFYFESFGLAREHSEVSVALSRDVLLWATWRTDLP